MRIKLSRIIIFSIVIFVTTAFMFITIPSVTVLATPIKHDVIFYMNIKKQTVIDNKNKSNIESIFTAKLEDIRQLGIDNQAQITAPSSTSTQSYSNGSGLTPSSGVNYHDGWRETYYSSNVLYHYRTGEWTIDNNGVYRDSDGYVIVASSSDAQGSVVSTSFGPGKVYDSGCAADTHDIYTNW